jgi:transcriptional regulator with XRE-family HTH domain
MSPPQPKQPGPPEARQSTARIAAAAGTQIHAERLRRRWALRELARRAGLSVAAVHDIEAGRPALIQSYARLGEALDLRLDMTYTDPRQRTSPTVRAIDLVHSAMGDFEVTHLAGFDFPVGVDEPYQHYQFAGRADVVAWDLAARTLLHIENRTRFPDLQEAAGSWNAKRSYLPGVLSARLGMRRGWASVTNVMAVLWSSEVMHAVRLRTGTFRGLCPDGLQAFAAWWAGMPPKEGTTSTFVALDPWASSRARVFVGLEDALRADVRYRGYADAAARLRRR